MVSGTRPPGLEFHDARRRKHDDHEASHSHRTNQVLHLISSSVFILCYGLVFNGLATASRRDWGV